ncbi:hypothetical protein Q5P01_018935 [Channa striata]|uniref:Immunoglobulin V-set domain-containing protein n=1 Tax=Channa striata TaxID=64152 RepID=A0AA88M042_CHASR|nr:hypothetical protein Q5P01_018935 [Channa striata]
MLVLVQLVTVMPMKSEASSADDTSVSTNSDGSVLLASGLMLGRMEQRWDDIRWTHRHLVVSLKNNMTRCHHGRCELLSDGSLMFRTVQNEDLGNYSLEVFDEDGTRLMKREFVLREGGGESSSSSVVVSISCLLLLFLLLFIIIFILRRRIQRTNTPGRREENVYVTMHSQHGNKKKDDTEKQEKEEDSVYVSCHPIAVETPMTEDIYV